MLTAIAHKGSVTEQSHKMPYGPYAYHATEQKVCPRMDNTKIPCMHATPLPGSVAVKCTMQGAPGTPQSDSH